jgi:hypothetical protein
MNKSGKFFLSLFFIFQDIGRIKVKNNSKCRDMGMYSVSGGDWGRG